MCTWINAGGCSHDRRGSWQHCVNCLMSNNVGVLSDGVVHKKNFLPHLTQIFPQEVCWTRFCPPRHKHALSSVCVPHFSSPSRLMHFVYIYFQWLVNLMDCSHFLALSSDFGAAFKFCALWKLKVECTLFTAPIPKSRTFWIHTYVRAYTHTHTRIFIYSYAHTCIRRKIHSTYLFNLQFALVHECAPVETVSLSKHSWSAYIYTAVSHFITHTTMVLILLYHYNMSSSVQQST
jgi:hypothetical protein